MTTMTVGELAEVSGVTVRALHHYDEIGLLVPSIRTEAGYRIYTDADIDRLQAILTYRELGLGLGEIGAAVDAPEASARVLRTARQRLDERIAKLNAIAQSLDAAIAQEGKEPGMTPEEKLSVFGDFDPSEHEEEARQRWGDSDAYVQSAQRTSRYTKQDWEAIQAEAADVYAGFAALQRRGIAPDSAEAAAAVETQRDHISRWFYDCSPEIHAGLGQMYVADQRFADSIDKSGEGLSAFMSAAIAAAYAE